MLAFSLLALAAATSWDQLETYRFSDYVQEFERSYSSSEFTYRQSIFDARLNAIKQHNANPHRSYNQGVNKFSDLTTAEFRKYLGYAAGRPSLGLHSSYERKNISAAPASVDWRTKNVVTPVKNQGGCGSCWAFAATETIESMLAMAGKPLLVLSEQDMVSCTPNPQSCGGTGGCGGATAELGFAYVKDKGIASEKDYPYRGITGTCDTTKPKSAKVTGWTVLKENDHDDVFNAIQTVGPLAITVEADTWMAYENGVFDGCTKDADLDHGVQMVGYGTEAGTDYWLVRNSWGASWGEQGYIKIKRFATSTDYCGTDHNPSDGTGCKGGPTTVPVCGMCGILYDVSYPTV